MKCLRRSTDSDRGGLVGFLWLGYVCEYDAVGLVIVRNVILIVGAECQLWEVFLSCVCVEGVSFERIFP